MRKNTRSQERTFLKIFKDYLQPSKIATQIPRLLSIQLVTKYVTGLFNVIVNVLRDINIYFEMKI